MSKIKKKRLYGNSCRARQTKRLAALFKIRQLKYSSAVLRAVSRLRNEGLGLFVSQISKNQNLQNPETISAQLGLILPQKAGERIEFVTCWPLWHTPLLYL